MLTKRKYSKRYSSKPIKYNDLVKGNKKSFEGRLSLALVWLTYWMFFVAVVGTLYVLITS